MNLDVFLAEMVSDGLLGFQTDWTQGEKPSPEEQREQFHNVMMEIKEGHKEIGVRRGGYIIINPDRGAVSEDESRREWRDKTPRYCHNHNQGSTTKRVPPPEQYQTWGELVKDLLVATGLNQKNLALVIRCGDSTLSRYITHGIFPTEPIRNALLSLAKEYNILDEGEAVCQA